MPDDDCQSCYRNVANKVLLSTVTVQDLLPEFVQYGNMTLMEYIFPFTVSTYLYCTCKVSNAVLLLAKLLLKSESQKFPTAWKSPPLPYPSGQLHQLKACITLDLVVLWYTLSSRHNYHNCQFFFWLRWGRTRSRAPFFCMT